MSIEDVSSWISQLLQKHSPGKENIHRCRQTYRQTYIHTYIHLLKKFYEFIKETNLLQLIDQKKFYS